MKVPLRSTTSTKAVRAVVPSPTRAVEGIRTGSAPSLSVSPSACVSWSHISPVHSRHQESTKVTLID